MKIAIIHDNFAICGGGEKLISILSSELEKKGHQIEIFTFDLSEDTKKIINKKIKIHTIKEGNVSQKILFSKLRITKKFDFYIFSGYNSLACSHRYSPNLFYCHNLPEYLGKRLITRMNDAKSEMLWEWVCKIKNKIIKKPIPCFAPYLIDMLRIFLAYISKETRKEKIKELRENLFFNDIIFVEHIQKIVVNSKNIRNKVEKRYKRDAVVIYPPVETRKYFYRENKGYWLSINRITPKKRIEIQLKAFVRLPEEKLFVIGNKENKNYFEYLEKIKPENVFFGGVIEENDLLNKLSGCKGLIFTATDEDFGLAPVEAMASGKPVIAPNEGGCKETIINEKTGILIDDINENKLADAVKKLGKEIDENPLKYKKACQEQAKKFDTKIFIEEMKNQIKLVSN